MTVRTARDAQAGPGRGTRSKRGRPTAAEAAAIDHAIHAAAAELFLRDGFATTPMEQVAATAGVSKGTLYARYPNKEKLLRAFAEQRVKAWSDASSARDHLLGDTLHQRLRHHVETIARASVSPEIRRFQVLMTGISDDFPELARAYYESGYLFTVDLLEREIRNGTRDDPLAVRDAKMVAEMLIGVITGWCSVEQSVREVLPDEAVAFAHRALDMLLAGRAEW